MYDLIIVGSGPSGLSCAIGAKNAGLSAIVLEKGSLADSIRRFPVNLVWFSTPEMLEIGGIPFAVSTTRPTRIDTLNYYEKVARHFQLDIRYYDPVRSVCKKDDGSFSVTTDRGRSYAGMNVVVATGYFDQPNRINVPGENLPKVLHYYNEAFPYFDLNVAVVGGSNSAVEAALDLYRHGAHVTLIHRREKVGERVKYWVVPDIENRIKSGEIKALFISTVCEIRPESILVKSPKGVSEIPNDFIFILTGFLPDSAHSSAAPIAALRCVTRRPTSRARTAGGGSRPTPVTSTSAPRTPSPRPRSTPTRPCTPTHVTNACRRRCSARASETRCSARSSTCGPAIAWWISAAAAGA